MAFNFKNNPNAEALSEREKLEKRYNSARYDVLLMVILTIVNIVLVFAESDTYFLFSITVPYLCAVDGIVFSGVLSPEFYEAIGLGGVELLGVPYLIEELAIAAVILALYVACYILSKNNKVGWLIGAAVLLTLDMIWFIWEGLLLDSILDAIIHIVLLVYLVIGIAAHYKLKKLAPEGDVIEGEAVAYEEEESYIEEADEPINE